MRIVGVNIPDNKKVVYALPYIYGIGRTLAQKIVAATKINPNTRAKDLTQQDVAHIKEYIEKYCKVEGELRALVRQNITLLKEMQTYRGNRHARHLPVRGQRTKTNSRTVRGNVRKTAGSGKRKIELK